MSLLFFFYSLTGRKQSLSFDEKLSSHQNTPTEAYCSLYGLLNETVARRMAKKRTYKKSQFKDGTVKMKIKRERKRGDFGLFSTGASCRYCCRAQFSMTIFGFWYVAVSKKKRQTRPFLEVRAITSNGGAKAVEFIGVFNELLNPPGKTELFGESKASVSISSKV